MHRRVAGWLSAAAIGAFCGLLVLGRRPEPPPPPKPLPPECVQGLGWMAQAIASEVDRATRANLQGLSREDELRLGQRLLERQLEEHPVHPGWTRYATTVLNRLMAGFPEHHYPYSVTVLDTPQLSGSALPGGPILLHRGLLADQVEDEAELATALAHEMAHIELGHAAAVWSYLASVPELRDNEALALARYGFSATRELEADRLGLTLARLAGYDAGAGVSLWQRSWPEPTSPSPLLAVVHPWMERLDTEEAREALRDMAERAGVSSEEPSADLAILLASHPPPPVRACVMRATASQLDAELGPSTFRGAEALAVERQRWEPDAAP